MSNKTISINPSLFNIKGTKTKKNKENKPKIPLISPNVLKNKLLKRIKEHKQKENQTQNQNQNQNQKEQKEPELNTHFSDEFSESINYLQTLSTQKTKQKLKEELERKTIKNYNHIQPIINIDLPEELIQPIQPIQPTIIVNNDVPYGILKGGSKPTYKEWTRTQRNNIVTNPNSSLIIENNNLISQKTERENRLSLLKQKIKNKNNENNIFLTENLINPVPLINQIPTPVIDPSPSPVIPTLVNNNPTNGNVIATKHITKKTIKRKYTLGRSKLNKRVGVLIKDRGTRKQILQAQKELKRKNINDIKSYLREHNLIKIGSSAPNDVLRKIYESSMLAGEITNLNAELLLDNFSKKETEL
jgi:hypothetical protein